MKRRVSLFLALALLVAGSLPAQVAKDELPAPLDSLPAAEGGACSIVNLQGAVASGFLSWNAPGAGLAILVDPTATGGPGDPGCGGGDFGTQNFRIDDVVLDIADEFAFGTGTGIGTADWSVTIHSFATAGDPCSGPGAVLFDSGTLNLTMNGSGQYFPSVPVGIEVNEPFFVQWNLQALGNPAETVTPLWDAIARPLCTQFVTQDSGAMYQDFTDFFVGGNTGWVDVNVNGEFVDIASDLAEVPTLGPLGYIGLITLLAFVGLIALRRVF